MNPELRKRLEKARARSADIGARAEKPGDYKMDWEDVGKSTLTGIRSGLESTAGSVGDIGGIQSDIASYGLDRLGLTARAASPHAVEHERSDTGERGGLSPEAVDFISTYTNPMSLFADTEDISGATDALLGRDDYTRHEATSEAGQHANVASNLLSGLIGGPENFGKDLALKLGMAAIPAAKAGRKALGAADEVVDFFGDFTRKVPEAEPGYAYHTSPRQNAMDIREEGSIGTFEPWHGTEQDAWPDASVEPRSYWGESPGGTVPFSQDQPTLWRAKRDERFRSERGTRDLYATEPISGVEYYGEGGGWHPAGPTPTKVPATAVTRDDLAQAMPPGKWDITPSDPNQMSVYSGKQKDPEFFHKIGGGTKMTQPLSEMSWTTTPTGEGLPPQKPFNPEDLQGSRGVMLLGDKTRSGETLVDVNGIPLTKRQPIEGGYRFMDEFPGSIWASKKNVMEDIVEKAQSVSDEGKKRVVGLPVSMGAPAGDSARMMTGPLLDLMRQAELTPEAKTLIDQIMTAELTDKKGRVRWPGIEPVLKDDDWLQNAPGSERAALAKAMTKPELRDPRVPVPALRAALTADDLLHRPSLTTGMNVGEFDLGRGFIDDPVKEHNTYSGQGAGSSLGRIGTMPYDWIFQDFAKTRPVGESEPHTLRSILTQIPTQDFNQEWLDNLMAKKAAHERGRQ